MGQSVYVKLSQTTPARRIAYVISLAVAMLGIIEMAAIGPNKLYYIVNNTQFILIFTALGLILALATFFSLAKLSPDLFLEPFIKGSVQIFLTIGIVLIMLYTAAFINNNYAFKNINYLSFKITGKQIYHVRNRVSYDIEIRFRQIDKRVKVNPNTYDSLKVGSYLKIRLRHGLLNYDFIDPATR